MTRAYRPHLSTVQLADELRRAMPGTSVRIVAPHRGSHPTPARIAFDTGRCAECERPRAEHSPTPGAHAFVRFRMLTLAEARRELAFARAIAYAAERGAEDGRNAPDWQYLPGGGRSSATVAETGAWAKRTLRGLADGDPETADYLPRADLSGEWAGVMTGPELVADALAAAGLGVTDTGETVGELVDWFTDICDAYESAFDTAAEDAIAAYARGIAPVADMPAVHAFEPDYDRRRCKVCGYGRTNRVHA